MTARNPFEIKSDSPPNQAGGSSKATAFAGGPVFWGPNGLRAGWRILVAAAIWSALTLALSFAIAEFPWARAQFRAASRVGEQGPSFLLLSEGITVVSTFLTFLAMTRIEQRTFADYYLPISGAFGRRFWMGLAYGLATVSLLMGLIAALHGFSLGVMVLDGRAALTYGALYGAAFLLVGLFEEATFRGYLQSTLGSGIGFWPAAIALALVFGGSHLSNPGEARYGALMAGCFGLLAVFTLARTGSLWFAIGMHSAWDWGESFLYSVPDSGLTLRGHLFNSSFHGPAWLTGGTVGPEASVFAFVALLVAAAGVHFLFPRKPTQTELDGVR